MFKNSYPDPLGTEAFTMCSGWAQAGRVDSKYHGTVLPVDAVSATAITAAPAAGTLVDGFAVTAGSIVIDMTTGKLYRVGGALVNDTETMPTRAMSGDIVMVKRGTAYGGSLLLATGGTPPITALRIHT